VERPQIVLGTERASSTRASSTGMATPANGKVADLADICRDYYFMTPAKK
jgi:hypothetical protein